MQVLDSRRTAVVEDSSIIEFGPFSIDERERLLRRHGQPVPLTPKAVDVLLALVERPGRLMTKDDSFSESGQIRSLKRRTSLTTYSRFARHSETRRTTPSTSKRLRSAATASKRRCGVRMATGTRLTADGGIRSRFTCSRDSGVSRTAYAPLRRDGGTGAGARPTRCRSDIEGRSGRRPAVVDLMAVGAGRDRRGCSRQLLRRVAMVACLTGPSGRTPRGSADIRAGRRPFSLPVAGRQLCDVHLEWSGP